MADQNKISSGLKFSWRVIIHISTLNFVVLKKSPLKANANKIGYLFITSSCEMFANDCGSLIKSTYIEKKYYSTARKKYFTNVNPT